MSGAFKLIEGEVEDPKDRHIAALKEQVRELSDALDEATAAAADAKRDATRAISRLRAQLEPLYRALRGIFGEMDAAGVNESAAPERTTRGSAVWDEWKARLGPGCTKVIDVLLLGGEMTITAISVAGKMGKRQVYEATAKMGQVGILVKNGGKFSLKQL
jgi:chromosome segregation ATPase